MGDIESWATNETDQDMYGNLNLWWKTSATNDTTQTQARQTNGDGHEIPILWHAPKKLNCLSRRQQLNELKICVNTNALNTSVWTMPSWYSLGCSCQYDGTQGFASRGNGNNGNLIDCSISKKPGELSAIIRNYNCCEWCNWIPDWQSTKLITMVC